MFGNYNNFEEEIIEYIIKKVKIEEVKTGKSFFAEGPPFVSGVKLNDIMKQRIKKCLESIGIKDEIELTNLHWGTMLQILIKSTIINYHMMIKDKNINHTTGSDALGFPTIDFCKSMLDLKTNEDINNYGLDKFVNYSIKNIYKYEDKWDNIFNSFGRICGKEDHYRTCDYDYINNLWFCFKILYEKKYIYKGAKVLPFSYGLHSVLSNFEASECYEKVNAETVYFKLQKKDELNTFYIAWTTTPFSIIGNIALCVNPLEMYSKVYMKDNNIYIISKKQIEKVFNKKEIERIEDYKIGKEMKGEEYIPVYDYFKDIKHIIIYDDYVKIGEDESTGIVHISPFLGDDDFRVITENNIMDALEILNRSPIDNNGEYIFDDELIKHRLVFDTSKDIIKNLKFRNLIYKTKQINHTYPYCPRTHTPLINKVSEAYFINVSKQEVKDKLLKFNENVNWYPSSAKQKYINWIKNIKDWCISRSQVFGAPIPIWINEENNEEIVLSSAEDLKYYQVLINGAVCNITKIKSNLSNIIDNIIILKDGKQYKRINYTFDCWFCSGASSFARFKNVKENLFDFYDIDYMNEFACEGIEQVNKWFYCSAVLCAILFNKPFCHNIMCSGLVLAEDGTKMSKHKGNYDPPEILIKKYGADSIRLYLLKSNVCEGENLKFNENDIPQIKQKLIQFMNACILYNEYGGYLYNQKNIKFDNIDINLKINDLDNIFDKWIISKIEELTDFINNQLSNYKLKNCAVKIIDFIDDFTNSYIKLNRDRIKGLIDNKEQINSIKTLQYVIFKFIKLIKPFIPFISEKAYQELKKYNNEKEDNLYYVDYPKFNKDNYDKDIIKNIKIFNDIITLSRSLRQTDTRSSSLKKPVKSIKILHNDLEFLNFVKSFEDILENELFTLNLSFENVDKYEEYIIEFNKRETAKYHKSIMKDLNKIINSLNDNKEYLKHCYYSKELIKYNDIEFNINEYIIKPIINYDKKENHLITIDNSGLVIDIEIEESEIVNNEYMIRQIIKSIQNKRKDLGLHFYNEIQCNIYFEEKKYEVEFCNNKKDNIMNKLHCNDINFFNVCIVSDCDKFNKLEILDLNGILRFTIYYEIIIKS